MNKRYYSQQNQSELNGNQHQYMPFIYTVQPEEDNEGGLNLGELLSVIHRRIIVIGVGTTTVIFAALAWALISPSNYVAKFEILTEPVTAEDKVTPNDRAKVYETSNKIDETKLKILASPKLMSPIIQQVKKHYPDSKEPQLNIKLVPNTQILEVSYQDTNPEKVLFVLNKVSEAYLKYSLEERQTETQLGIKFVEEQLPELLQQVENLQSQLQIFRQQYGLINAEIQSQQLAGQYYQIVQNRLDTETQLAKAQTSYNSLQKQLRLETDEAEAISSLSESPGYQKLLNQLQDVEVQIAGKSVDYTENNPSLQKLLIQRQNLLDIVTKEKQRILGSPWSNTTMNSLDSSAPNSARLRAIQKFLDVDKEIQVLKTQIQSLRQSESALKQQVKQFPALIRRKDDLERKLKIAVDNLNHFLAEREKLRIDSAQKQAPWQVLTPPTQPENLAPSPTVNLILGTALGLLLSTGFALLIDKFNNVFYNLEEVKEKTKMPILGVIPHIRLGKDGKLRKKQDISNLCESFRSIYTNIFLLNNENSIRSLAIISAAPGDGKSIIALYLAQTAAAMGKRVLLVDANLRKPTIHTMLGLPNTKGLSNLISEELNFENVIHRLNNYIRDQKYGSQTAIFKDVGELSLEHNLFVLTTGQISLNPTILLSSPQMPALAEEFKRKFDLIIYDTSNVLDFADTSLLNRHTDASVLAMGIGKTNRYFVTKVLEQFNFSSSPILGVIAVDIQGNAIK
ncbi:polysaccharide biosynthesis tyrosine autokinase [Sphaerospermopsis sp. LEGE 08334]|jgi:succinoglycan biosynthesis transport protein ExoP|uniref:GumC family protein n=1 Tax=Sphaerospermopsis sp. LEGE 08334 TaxID=1828651 RepID=UPI00187E06F4|nr:polysaccharide biosynthesis tyrosine autokinase [Sphaerospermopsis sp. LEGE 08334]MBE9055508.1 polysaccharide biosynthesis tyrosine autokinase [Sphaerospermopsis sp. LEGE 08334]